jgi:transposase
METYLGIDVSKGYADFTLLDKNKKELEKVFQLDDTRAGHDALKELMQQFIKQHHISTMYCGVESTGGFENNWYAWLVQLSGVLPLKAARLNPSGVKNNAVAGLERNITDALSSRYIAEYLIAHADKVTYDVQDDKYGSFRSMHKHINLLKKQNTQLINEMKMVLYSSFPEMMRYCKQGIPEWVLDVLKKHASSTAIAKLKAGQLTKFKHVTEEKAQALLAKAKSSVASRTSAMQEFLIKSLAKQISDKQGLIEEHKNFLIKNCKGEEVNTVVSIPGIGFYSAAAIMIEIEDIHHFATPAHLASYFGVHPVMKESGDKQFAFRMSKKGRASMRAILYMCAQTAVMHDAHLKSIYHRHRSKGKNHKQAIGVIMHKILRIIWGLLTKKETYNAVRDQKNQSKKTATPKESKMEELKTKRRYQTLDTEAPVSNMQTRKRKAHIESQVSEAEQARDLQHAPVVNI